VLGRGGGIDVSTDQGRGGWKGGGGKEVEVEKLLPKGIIGWVGWGEG